MTTKAHESPVIEDRLYSVRNAAVLLDVTPDTVRSYVRSGRLTAHKLSPSGPWRVDPGSLRRILETDEAA